MRRKVWAVDFDGTLCENRWPSIGLPHDDVINALKVARQCGVRLVLWTCRTGTALDDAIIWCTQQGLIFDAINDNVPDVIDEYGCNPRKITADLYIDDRSIDPHGGIKCLIGRIPTQSVLT